MQILLTKNWRYNHIVSIVFFLFIFLIFFQTKVSADASWYDDAWEKRIKITVDSSTVNSINSSGLTNFPVYLDLSLLPDEFFDSDSGVMTNGADIVFTKADGISTLKREIVSIDKAAKTGEIWFDADSLSESVDTEFYLYFEGNDVNESFDTTLGLLSTSDVNVEAHFKFNDLAPIIGNEIFPVDSHTVGLYRMNEIVDNSCSGGKDVCDISGNNYHGTIVGDVSRVQGLAGNAYYFDGDGDYVQIDTNYGLTTQGSIEFFVKDTTQEQGYILNIADNTGMRGLSSLVTGNNGLGYAYIDTTTGEVTLTKGHSYMTDNYWHYVAITYDGSVFSFYVDGAISDQTLKSGDYNNDSNITYLGVYKDTLMTEGYAFQGTIDELRISNIARTASEVNNIANQIRGVTSEIEDSNGYGLNITREQSAKFGQSYQFNDLSYITIPIQPENYLDEMTIEAVYKQDSNESQFGYLVNIFPNTNIGNIGNSLFTNSNGGIYGRFLASTTEFSDKIQDFADGIWHYAATTYDGTTQYVYLDGVAYDPITKSGNVDIGYKGCIGQLSAYHNTTSGSTYGYNGYIDELRVSSRALDGSEISVNYQKFQDMDTQLNIVSGGIATIESRLGDPGVVIISQEIEDQGITFTTTEGDDVTEVTQQGPVNVEIKKYGKSIVETEIDIDGNLDMSDVTIESTEKISVFHIPETSAAKDAITDFSLYVPKQIGDNAVIICPGATDSNLVSENCENSILYKQGNPDLSIVTKGGREYWKIDGLTGTGGIGTFINPEEFTITDNFGVSGVGKDVYMQYTSAGLFDIDDTILIEWEEDGLVELDYCDGGSTTDADQDGQTDGSISFPESNQIEYTFSNVATQDTIKLCIKVKYSDKASYSVLFNDSFSSYGMALYHVDDNNDVLVKATIEPTLSFNIRNWGDTADTNVCDLGVITTQTQPDGEVGGFTSGECGYGLAVGTNASGGFQLRVNSNHKMTDGLYTISDVVSGFTAGTEAYGFYEMIGAQDRDDHNDTGDVLPVGSFVGLDGGTPKAIPYVSAGNEPLFAEYQDPMVYIQEGGADDLTKVIHAMTVSAGTPAGTYTHEVTYLLTASY